MEQKFFAVTKGRQVGVFDDYLIAEKQLRNFNGATYKIFTNYDEAYEYVKQNQVCNKHNLKKSQINRIEHAKRKNKAILKNYYCRSCGKPIKYKNKNNKGLCKHCLDNPDIRGKHKNKPSLIKYEDETFAPQYIKDLLGLDKEFICINGSKRNPLIHFRCKRCDNDFIVRYEILKRKKGHDCEALISSGEAIVEDYLKKHNIPYKTQRNTLKCVNPETKHIMPYDFELIGKKAIIEVQGEQHRQFTPRFHIDNEGFEYQQKKDKYKKEYAISKGYTYIEIWYDEFDNGRYVEKIENAIK